MGYNNQNNYNFQNNGGYNNNNNNYQQSQQLPPKRSGAKEGRTKHGKLYLSAWKVGKRSGMVTVSAFENKRSTWYKENRRVTLMCEVIFKDQGTKMLELVHYNLDTGKAFLPKLGLVLSTKAARGGYLGKKGKN